jgi:hypothetical protein
MDQHGAGGFLLRSMASCNVPPVRPELPKMSDEWIALKIATALYAEVNFEDCYWFEHERESIIDRMAEMIMRQNSVEGIFGHLQSEYKRASGDTGSNYPWGYPGVQEYSQIMLTVIATGILDEEIDRSQQKYNVTVCSLEA